MMHAIFLKKEKKKEKKEEDPIDSLHQCFVISYSDLQQTFFNQKRKIALFFTLFVVLPFSIDT